MGLSFIASECKKSPSEVLKSTGEFDDDLTAFQFDAVVAHVRLGWENERDLKRFKFEHKAFRNDLRQVIGEALGGEPEQSEDD